MHPSILAVVFIAAIAVAIAVALGAFGSGSSAPSQGAFDGEIAAVCARAQTAAAKIPPPVPGHLSPWIHAQVSMFETAVSGFQALTPPAGDTASYRAYLNDLATEMSLIRQVGAAAERNETARLAPLESQIGLAGTNEARDANAAGFAECNVSGGTGSDQASSENAASKELAHTAQVAAESYATDNSGSYVGLTPTKLNEYEATIQIAPGGGNAWVSSVRANASAYTITVTPASGSERFSITRNNGVITRTCTPAQAPAAGCLNGAW